jgi:hypothetical protein
VWHGKKRDTYPNLELYNADESHPSPLGSYLAACVFYSTLYKKNCQGAFVPPTINADTALLIQQIASAMVLDSLSNWYLGNLQSQAFGINISGSTAYFTDNSINAGTITWNFGDGSFGEGASVQHTYADSGWYNISQTITNDCFTSTQEGQIYIPYLQPSTSTTPDNWILVQTSGNVVYLQSNQVIDKIVVTDMWGRQNFYINNTSSWNSEALLQGIYFMQMHLQSGEVISRKVSIAF